MVIGENSSILFIGILVLKNMNRRSSHSYSHYLQGSETVQTRRYSTHNIQPHHASPSRIKPLESVFPHLNGQKINRDQISKLSQFNCLEKYQLLIQSREEEHLRRKRYEKKIYKRRLPTEGIRVNTEILNNLVGEIKDLRRELSAEKEAKIEKQTRIITEFAESQKLRERMQAPPSMPFILPIYLPQQPFIPHYQSKLISTRQKPPEERIVTQRSTRGSFLRRLSRRKMGFLWKKLVNVTWFVIYFRRFCRVARQSRKIAFRKFHNSIDQKLYTVRTILNQGLQSFLSLLQQHADRVLEIKSEDSIGQTKQKVQVVRQLTASVLKGIFQSLKQNVNSEDLIDSLYYFCKHGNYSCSQPLLTKQQLQICCISPVFGYVSADKNLEKSLIINFLLVKLLLYNTFLKKHMKQSQEAPILQNKFILISSILLELLVEIQNKYLQEVPLSYKIGNYKHQDATVRGLASMVVADAKAEEGKLISGLKQSQWINQEYKPVTWKKEKKIIQDIVQLCRTLIVRHHDKVIQKLK